MHAEVVPARMSDGNKRKAVGPRKLEDLRARCMQNCSIQVIPARMSDGNKKKAAGPRKLEDLRARCMHSISLKAMRSTSLKTWGTRSHGYLTRSTI